MTAALVLAGWLLLAWDAFGAGINIAPFFGEVPSRDRYIESGATLLTALVPVALLCLIGVLRGSRFGLLFLVVPALVLTIAGINLLTTDGDPRDPDPTRAVTAGDFVQDLTWLNWITTGVLLLVLVAMWLVHRSRRASAT
jgi:hypothetical protein